MYVLLSVYALLLLSSTLNYFINLYELKKKKKELEEIKLENTILKERIKMLDDPLYIEFYIRKYTPYKKQSDTVYIIPGEGFEPSRPLKGPGF